MCQVLFRSNSSLMSYHPDIVIFPYFERKRGHNSANSLECAQIRTWPSFYCYIHMCRILFGSINSFISYHPDKEKPTDKRTDGPTDGQAHSYISPLQKNNNKKKNFVCWGIIMAGFNNDTQNYQMAIPSERI